MVVAIFSLVSAIIFLGIGFYLGTLVDEKKAKDKMGKIPGVKKPTRGKVIKPSLSKYEEQEKKLRELEERIEAQANES